MDLGVISVRYARALLKSSEQSHQEEKVYHDMQNLLANYLQVPQLRTTIDNPMLDDAKKIAVLNAACGDKPIELTKRFVKLVVDEGREQDMQFMAASYITLYRQQKNIKDEENQYPGSNMNPCRQPTVLEIQQRNSDPGTHHQDHHRQYQAPKKHFRNLF